MDKVNGELGNSVLKTWYYAAPRIQDTWRKSGNTFDMGGYTGSSISSIMDGYYVIPDGVWNGQPHHSDTLIWNRNDLPMGWEAGPHIGNAARKIRKCRVMMLQIIDTVQLVIILR